MTALALVWTKRINMPRFRSTEVVTGGEITPTLRSPLNPTNCPFSSDLKVHWSLSDNSGIYWNIVSPLAGTVEGTCNAHRLAGVDKTRERWSSYGGLGVLQKAKKKPRPNIRDPVWYSWLGRLGTENENHR